MAKRVLLLHGWGGSNYPHWQSWLAGEVAKAYGCVSFLKLPNFDTPKLHEWLEAASKEFKQFQPDVVICHSLGNTLWFWLAQKGFVYEVEKLFLVAPPSLQCSIKELEEFFPVDIPKNLSAKEVELIVSDNDPYMGLDEAKMLQKELQCDMEILKNAGHINSESGFGAWPFMLEKLQKIGVV